MNSKKLRVLVVDDDRRMVRTIFDILMNKGYEAVSVHTGEDAVEKVRKEKFDCVLMDIRMPGISGIEACGRIHELSPNLPVILASAYATEEMEAEARKYGAYAVMIKPLDLQRVLSFLSLLMNEESILIVDDDTRFSMTLKDILKARGYRVQTESNPEKVLGHMEQNYKLVVLLDLKLGDADGLDVLKELRAKYPSKPVVLVTGYREEMAGSIQKGLQIGAYTCLYKPLEIEKLLELIRDVSRRKVAEILGEEFEKL